MTATTTGREQVEDEPPSWAVEAISLYRFFRAGDEETPALRGVSLSVAVGEMVAVVGPSGSGKSTLLALLAGLDEPDGGTVRIHGERLSHRREPVRARIRARSVGVLFQATNLMPQLTVTDNVALVQRIAGGAERPGTAELLAKLGLSSRATSYPGALSGGELARAGLAVAMANGPAVLLADEPTGELDGDTEAEVLALLVATARAGVAILVASHSPAVAAAAGRVITLADGVLVS